MAEEDQTDDLDEDEEGEDGEGSSKEGGGKKKLIIIIAAAVLLLIGGLAGAYFTGLLDPLLGGSEEPVQAGGAKGSEDESEGDEEEGEADEEAEDGEAGKEKVEGSLEESVEPLAPGFFHELPEITVNLKGRGRKKKFLKLQLSLELNSEDDVAVIEGAIARVNDNFNVFLREMRVEDLEGSAGMYRVREELLLRINAAITPLKVRDVLFKEMLIQ